MSTEEVKRGRKLLHDKFGEAFASKASEELCISLLRAEPSTRGLEDMTTFREGLETASLTPSNVVLEFKHTPVSRTKTKTTESRIRENLGPASKKISKVSETWVQNLRKFQVNEEMSRYREQAMMKMQSSKAFLEKSIERSFSRTTKSLENYPSLTQTCWLNQCVRAIPQFRSLAEMASNQDLQNIDLPRKLQREIDSTGTGLFATQYRKKFSHSGKDILVGVIDSEVALDHPAFKGRIVHKQNFTKESWGNPDSHGTAVAGIIGSADMSFSGMAPNVKLHNYKVLATDESLNADDFEGSLAVERALEDGMQIVNCSWGAGPIGTTPSREARACDTAWGFGLTVVKSAGNRGPGVSTLTTPADADNIIVVGATDKKFKKLQDYSSRGPLLAGTSKRPHLLAPGGTQTDGIFSCTPVGGFGDTGAGTSYAAPHVTGLLALLLEANPSFSNDDLLDALLKLCTKLAGVSADAQGSGVVSLKKLLGP